MPDGVGCLGTQLGSTDPCVPASLIFPRYNPITTVANTVSAGAMRQIQVTPAYQATPAPARITTLRLWISFDGGTTWQQERVRDHGGTWLASYHVPGSAAGESVSVKVQASDSAGDLVAQTIKDAYGVA